MSPYNYIRFILFVSSDEVLSYNGLIETIQLEHLKRIRSGTGATDMLEIIVCPVVSFHDISAEVRNLLGAFREVLVSRCPPTNRDEFNKFGSYWPVNYRPRQPEHVELLSPLENDLFDEYFQDVIRIGKDLYHLTGKDDIGAIVVNPMNKKVELNFLVYCEWKRKD